MSEHAQRVLSAAVEFLERGGCEAVTVRGVARVARVSHSKIYQIFGTRDELIVAAISRWTATHTELPFPSVARRDNRRQETLVRLFFHHFDPWRRHPNMLRAYYRAKSGPGGERLERVGFAARLSAALATVLADADADYRTDMLLVLSGLAESVALRYAETGVEHDIRPTLERITRLLTSP
ncbi:TetR family transcriptional regulator [Nocardia sp. NPDC057455]|uniref:TetR family transcriptional regulator n=1 Tax=Nocardia sp. NPDC057455 TaxID=3346138 RepID=UPI00366AC1BE